MCKSNAWDWKAVVWALVLVHLLVALYLGFSHHFCFSNIINKVNSV